MAVVSGGFGGRPTGRAVCIKLGLLSALQIAATTNSLTVSFCRLQCAAMALSICSDSLTCSRIGLGSFLFLGDDSQRPGIDRATHSSEAQCIEHRAGRGEVGVSGGHGDPLDDGAGAIPGPWSGASACDHFRQRRQVVLCLRDRAFGGVCPDDRAR